MSEIPPEARFESVVQAIFRTRDFQVIAEPHRDLSPDFIAQWQDVRTVVEAKLYRSRHPMLRLIQQALVFVNECRAQYDADYGLLVLNLWRSDLRDFVSDQDRLFFLTLDDLLALASGNDELTAELLDIDRELSSSLRDFDEAPRRSPDPKTFNLEVLRRRPPGKRPPRRPRPTPGGDLCAKLREIPAGSRTFTSSDGITQSSWRHFEDVGAEVVQFLFQSQFKDWLKQKPVGDSGRFDLMAKVSGVDVFSRTLIEDFRSRFALFEFKNYGARIKPNLVHITEKYLYPTALRGTAFIISPNGPSKEALSASRGALRDAGKLVLHLTVDQLCEMLHAYDDGNAPSLYIEAHLDVFLRSVDR